MIHQEKNHSKARDSSSKSHTKAYIKSPEISDRRAWSKETTSKNNVDCRSSDIRKFNSHEMHIASNSGRAKMGEIASDSSRLKKYGRSSDAFRIHKKEDKPVKQRSMGKNESSMAEKRPVHAVKRYKAFSTGDHLNEQSKSLKASALSKMDQSSEGSGNYARQANTSEDGKHVEVPKTSSLVREKSNEAEKAVTTLLVDGESDRDRSGKPIDLKRKKIDELATGVAKANRQSAMTSVKASQTICRSDGHPEACSTSVKRRRYDQSSVKQGDSSANKKVNQDLGDISSNNGKEQFKPGVILGCETNQNNSSEQNQSSEKSQTADYQNVCFSCNLGGKLVCCAGRDCKRNFHLSCINRPLDCVPLGVWYCLLCDKKKIRSDVHVISEELESIWKTREVDIGFKLQKHYLVKYKGLAHVHNRWMSEDEVLVKAPSLVAEYETKGQATEWKQEWCVPHMLLRKRSLNSRKQHEGNVDIQQEWLVQWCGLGYEDATWESENASFLKCPEGQGLIRNYNEKRRVYKVPEEVSSLSDKHQVVVGLKNPERACKAVDNEFLVPGLPRAASNQPKEIIEVENLFLDHKYPTKQLERHQVVIGLKNPERTCKAVDKDVLVPVLPQAASNQPKGIIEVENLFLDHECPTKQLDFDSGPSNGLQLTGRVLSTSNTKIQKKNHKQKKLLKIYKNEKKDCKRKYVEEKENLNKKRDIEAAVVRLIYNSQVRAVKLKEVDDDFAKQLEELKCKRKVQRKDLDAVHVAAMAKVLPKEDHQVAVGRSVKEVELATPSILKPTSPRSSADKLMINTLCEGGKPSEICEKAVVCGDPTVGMHYESAELGTTVSEREKITGGNKCKGALTPSGNEKNVVDHSSEKQALVCNEPIDSVLTLAAPLSECQDCDGSTSIVSDEVVSINSSSQTQNSIGTKSVELAKVDVPDTVTSNDSLEAAPQVIISEQVICDGATINRPNVETPSALSEGPESIVPLTSVISEAAGGKSNQPSLECFGALENQNPIQNACSLPLMSTGIHNGAAETIGMHDIPHQTVPPLFCPVNLGASNELRSKTSILETGMHVHPVPSVYSIPSHNNLTPPSGCITRGSNEYPIVSEITQPSMQQMENCVEIPHPTMLSPENVAPRPTGNLAMGSTHIWDAWMPSTNIYLSSQNVQTAIPPGATMPLTLYHDPLEEELKRICKELYQTTNKHEESKKERIAACEKELEEVTAQIRRKYNTVQKEEDDSFELKKKELTDNHEKVRRSKILAEVFRAYSRIAWVPSQGIQTTQLDATSTYPRQLVQPPSWHPAPRPSIVTGWPSVLPPAQTPSIISNSNGLPFQAAPHPMLYQSLVSTRPSNIYAPPHLGGYMLNRMPAMHYQSSLPSTSWQVNPNLVQPTQDSNYDAL